MVEKCKATIDLDETVGKINPNIYGQFAEHIGELIYPGIWVGEESNIPNDDGIRKDLLEALKRINPPVIRWPGGCFADSYHWQDGIGPREKRPRRVNLWGEESNQFGTDDFLNLCSKVGAKPYICLNVGSGSPEEASSWVEYCNYGGNSYYAKLRAENGHPEPYRVRYWGVGNENYGCGGCFKPHEYAQEYRRFAGYIKRFSLPLSKEWCEIELVACGYTETREWNLKFMEDMKDYINLVDHLSIHHYFGGAGGDINFTDEEYYRLLAQVQELEYQIRQAIGIVDFFAEGRKDIGIIVDEWGSWHPQATEHLKRFDRLLRQQNTLRDAILAASVLNLFNRYSRKVVMTNISMMVNALHSLFLTNGSRMVTTPTYHVYDMYKEHMANRAVKVEASSPILKEAPPPPKVFPVPIPLRRPKPLMTLDLSASVDMREKQLVITLVNQSLDEEMETEIYLKGSKEMNEGKVTLLTAKDVRSYNDFDTPNSVKPSQETIKIKGKTMIHSAPPHSVNTLNIKIE